jgi:hypothetical protein
MSSHNKSKYKIMSLNLIKHHAIETYGGVEEELSLSIGYLYYIKYSMILAQENLLLVPSYCPHGECSFPEFHTCSVG